MGDKMTAFTITSININVKMPLTDKQWANLGEFDRVASEADAEVFFYEVLDKLEGIGLTDYNGHFGSSIYFNAENHALAEKACLYIESILGAK